MDIREAVLNRIWELCSKKDMSINRLAYWSAVPRSTVFRLMNGSTKNPGIVTIKILCDGLGKITADNPIQRLFQIIIYRQLILL